ncbi:repeat in ubiquitin-activating protein-domain-containing protein [Cytidiella melzeri]|nr:repeat in ubiquitin-activating protein-domain-containing protein [Cytidiella melzeri]
MEDMWRSRAKPTPLEFDGILDGTFTLSQAFQQPNGASPHAPVNGNVASSSASGSGSAATEKLLNGSFSSLASRIRDGEETISFDKDDDDTLDFVTAAANLRSAAYGIPGKSRWEVKEMAGNIIPAIATTNAIIAGLIVLQALHSLRKSYSALRNLAEPQVWSLQRRTHASSLRSSAVTLGEGVFGEGKGSVTGPREVSVYEEQRVLSDPDWDDNNARTLESLNVTRGKFLTIVDEESEYATIQVAIGALPPNNSAEDDALSLSHPLPLPSKIVKEESTAQKKRSAPHDDKIVEEPPAKRARMSGLASLALLGSPTKKRTPEEDGILLLETADEKVEVDIDVIEFD